MFPGIDAGSTTTKVAVVGEDGTLLYSFSNNNGSPLKTAIRSIQEIKNILPADAEIVRSCSTGYGKALMKSAFMLDEGKVQRQWLITMLPLSLNRTWIVSSTSADRI